MEKAHYGLDDGTCFFFRGGLIEAYRGADVVDPGERLRPVRNLRSDPIATMITIIPARML
jgi:hypothetical protein